MTTKANSILRNKWILVTLPPLAGIIQNAAAQSEEQLARYYERFPEADINQDGKLSAAEARNHRNSDPSRGDNLDASSEIPPVKVPLEQAPLTVVELTAPDGVKLDFAVRKPDSGDRLPAIIFFHGGGGMSDIEGLKKNLLNGAIQTRLLDKGYVTVQSTRRPYWIRKGREEPTGFADAVRDAVLVVEAVKELEGIDPDKIILYGGSGGGILAIVTAAQVEVAAVVAGEPATVIALDPKMGEVASPAVYQEIMEHPQSLYTGERKAEILAWMKNIGAPVLILQGNRTGLYQTNFEILIPEMKRLGKKIEYIEFPGLSHGFYWGTRKTGATLGTVETVVAEADAFIQNAIKNRMTNQQRGNLNRRPNPLDDITVEQLMQRVPDGVKVIPDIAYREGHERWKLDLAIPD